VRHPGMPSAAVIGELVATRWRYSLGLQQGFALFHTSTDRGRKKKYERI
jgi:hypothetical protein